MTLVFIGVWALYCFGGFFRNRGHEQVPGIYFLVGIQELLIFQKRYFQTSNCLEVSEVGEAETLQKDIPAPILSPHIDGFL